MNTVLALPSFAEVGEVVLLGVGIVFLGLICIILLCLIMGKVVSSLVNKEEEATRNVPAAVPAPVAEIPNRQELVAAISCDILAAVSPTAKRQVKICSEGYRDIVVNLSDLTVKERE